MMTAATQSQADPRGSVWRRWDPHIHTPGTAINNQFGQDAWDDYLTRIEQSEPRIEALGITDYCSIDEYEKALDFQTAGRLPGGRTHLPEHRATSADGDEGRPPGQHPSARLA